MSLDVPREGRRGTSASRRRLRQAEILAATRALFDARGVAEVQIEDIAGRVGINRAVIYRHFAGKDELFALTLVGYLDELSNDLRDADAAAAALGPERRLAALTAAFVDYGLAHPAFVDCAVCLMRRPTAVLVDEISHAAMHRLGRAVAGCLGVLVAVLHVGADAGVFEVDDAHVLAGTLSASMLGGLQLARIGLVVREAVPGVAATAPLPARQVRSHLVAAGVAMARGPAAEPS